MPRPHHRYLLSSHSTQVFQSQALQSQLLLLLPHGLPHALMQMVLHMLPKMLSQVLPPLQYLSALSTFLTGECVSCKIICLDHDSNLCCCLSHQHCWCLSRQLTLPAALTCSTSVSLIIFPYPGTILLSISPFPGFHDRNSSA